MIGNAYYPPQTVYSGYCYSSYHVVTRMCVSFTSLYIILHAVVLISLALIVC